MAPGLTYDPEDRRRWKDRIIDWFIGATILMIILVSAMLVVLQFPIPLRETPVVFLGGSGPDKTEYCPGEVMTFTRELEVTEPSILRVNVAVRDLDHNNIVNGTIIHPVFIPRDVTGVIDEPVHWTVPDLPPGHYARVTSIDLDHVDSVPIFSSIEFTVPEGCE